MPAAPRRSSAAAEAIVKIEEAYLRPLLEKSRPLLTKVFAVFAFIAPHLSNIYGTVTGLWEAGKPYHIDQLGPALLGFFLCFFGGNFVVLIATVEAFRTCGWTAMHENLELLYNDLQSVRKASIADDAVDADHDGKSDTQQLWDEKPDEWLMHKCKVGITNCDPEHIGSALGGLNSGVIAVLAVLKIEFAKAITLGATIGSILASYLDRHIKGPIAEVIDELEPSTQTSEKYKMWISPGIRYICQAIGIFVAFWIQRIISAFHAAIRGGEIFTAGMLGYLITFPAFKTYLDVDGDGKPDIEPGSKAFVFMALAMATLGFLFQLSHGFTNSSLFFPLNLVFLPLTIAETSLTWFVASN
jgi:hypothetical protein